MIFPIFKNTKTAERIFILGILLVMGFILGSIIPLLIFSLSDSTTELNTLRISQIISQLFVFILPPFLYALFVKEKPLEYLGFKKIPLWSLVGIIMMYAILPLNNVFAEWNASIRFPESMKTIEDLMKSLQEQATIITEKMLNVNDISGLIINLIMIAGLAAFGEELLFRSVLQSFLIRRTKNVHIGIFIASCIFSFIHFEFYGFIPRLILGMLLGYMFYFSGTIWVPMIMHFVNNGTAVILYYLNNKGITNIDVESFGKTEILPLVISIAVMILLFMFVIKHHKKLSE